MFFRLVKQIAEHESITETLKVEHPMEWVRIMNALREATTGIVNAKIHNLFTYHHSP